MTTPPVDLTTGPLTPLLLRLAGPTVTFMLLFQALSVVDLLFVRRLGDSAATAAVGVSTFAVALVLNLLNFGVGIGVTAMVARRTGEGRREEAQAMIRQGMLLIFVLGLGLGIPLALNADRILAALGQSEAVRAYAVPYIQIYACGFGLVLQSVAMRGAMQGLGDTLTPTILLAIANVVNALLDWALVTGEGPFPRMEVAGLAVGTLFAQAIQGALGLHLLRGGSYWGRLDRRWGWKPYPYDLVLQPFRPDLTALRAIWSIGWPTGMQGVLRSFAFLLLMGLAEGTRIGQSAVAAFTAGMQAEALAFLPVIGITTAVVSLVGQNIGAGKPERAEEAVRLGTRVAFIYLLVMCLLFILFPTQLVSVFLAPGDPWAVYSGAMYLYLTGFAEWTLFALVQVGALRAGGDAAAPLVIQLVGQYAIRLPLAWALVTWTTWDSVGLWVAVNISMMLEALAIHVRYRQGHWKRRVL